MKNRCVIHRLIIILGVMTGMTACTPTYLVRVDSIIAPQAELSAKTYYLDSGMANISRNDLYFQEFSRYLQAPLEKAGLQMAAGKAEAAILLHFSYGMSEGGNVYYTTHRPNYQLVGGETVTYRETKTDSSGTQSVVTGTVYVPLQYHYMGNVTETNSEMLYTGYFSLEARALDGDDKTPPLWKLTAKCTSPTADLRHLMPIMVQASQAYFSRNTGKEMRIKIKEQAPPKTVTPAGSPSTVKQ